MEINSPGMEEMYTELEDYERKGICILIDGDHVSPMQVVKAHMVKDGSASYMRDYEIDAEGRIQQISFTNINRRMR